MFDYSLVRSARRKTLSIQIKNGKMVVRAPKYLAEQEIELFIKKKRAWLTQKLSEQQLLIEQQHALKPSFTHNSSCYYLGEQKRLLIDFAPKTQVIIKGDILNISLSYRQQANITTRGDIAKAVKKALSHYFKKRLLTYLGEKIPLFAKQLQLFPRQYKVRYYKRRWGSCNNRAELSFNYLLIMAPSWVIDYVIVHELCHLKYLNHSTNFWQLVAEHQPNYQQAQQWLKNHYMQLAW